MSFKKFIPKSITSFYHLCVALLGAALYRYPSREIIVIGVTGTKGKSSTTEIISAILEAAGEKTALINSIRTKIDQKKERNLEGRSMPGRAKLQRFLRQAVDAGCTYAIIEMTSEGARQHRHRGIDLNALVFLNLAPEHIESHGSYQAYADAKFELARALEASPKRPRTIVANADDKESARYLALPIENRTAFSLAKHVPWETSPEQGFFTYEGQKVEVHLPGEFSLSNTLAATELAYALGFEMADIQKGIANIKRIPGRAERVEEGQNFTVVVDYAHTPESLEALYTAYPGRKIGVLGSAGGGRDRWKRPIMGAMAEKHCEVVILTSEDPYDEDPRVIALEMAAGMQKKPEIIVDRRDAIRRAFEMAKKGDTVLLTGQSINPMYVQGGKKIPWSDAVVAREELARIARRV